MSATSRARLVRCTATLGITATVLGCGGYGTVSDDAYEFAAAIYSAANRESTDGMARIAADLDSAVAESRVTASEGKWLREIVADAQAGEWKAARQAARRMMQDQVRPAGSRGEQSG